MINIFLSDIHIGIDVPTNVYQKSIHEKYLKAVLRYIQENSANVQDLVILGDWFDYWTYSPTGPIPEFLEEIFYNNRDVFSYSDDGDFITCMDSIQGNMVYLNGNHDITVSVDEINKHFEKLSRKGRKVICGDTPESNNVYQAGGIHAEHGHGYTLLCRLDNSEQNKYKPVPFGYFMTRTAGLYCEKKLLHEGMQNAAMLQSSGNPVISFETGLISLPYILKVLAGMNTLAEGILYDVLRISDFASSLHPEKFFYTMGDTAPSVNAGDIAANYSNLYDKSAADFSALVNDVTCSLNIPAEALCKENKVVIMGHTHVPMLTHHVSPDSAYVNSGFLCPNKPETDAGKLSFTFAEVEETTDSYIVRLKKVDYPDTTISTHGECVVRK